MTLDKIIQIVEPHFVSGTNCNPTGKVTDNSRDVASGDIFVAIRGKAFDGHQFIEEVIKSGAAVVVSEELHDSDKACILICKNTREVLGPLALESMGNPQSKLTLVGITGTNGKSTIAALVWQLLQKLGVRAALIGTVSKHFADLTESSMLTTPGSMELAGDLKKAVEANCSHFVMEVSSHALEQLRTKGLHFKVAVFSNLSHDHLDYHGTMKEYASAKKLLFDSLSDEAFAVVNFDDAWGTTMVENTEAQVWDLSLKSTDFRIEQIDRNGLLLNMDGIYIQSPLTGKFNAYNVAQAYLTAVALGFPARSVARLLSECTGAPGRLENTTLQVSNPSNIELPSVFVDYAHTPDALENVLLTLRDIREKGQPLYVIFGCGGDRDRTKRPKMAKVAGSNADVCIVTSDNPRTENPESIIDEIAKGFTSEMRFKREADRKKAIRDTILKAPSNAIILVAGKGHEAYQEIHGVRHPMDDREISRETLSERLAIYNQQEVN